VINIVISIQDFIPHLTIGPPKSREKVFLTSKGLYQPRCTVWSTDTRQRPVSAPLAAEPSCEAFFCCQCGEKSLREGSSRHNRKARSKHCCPAGQDHLSALHMAYRGKAPSPPASFSAAISSAHCSHLARPQRQQEQDAASLRSRSLVAGGYLGGKEPRTRLREEVRESERIPLWLFPWVYIPEKKKKRKQLHFSLKSHLRLLVKPILQKYVFLCAVFLLCNGSCIRDGGRGGRCCPFVLVKIVIE